MKVYNPVYNEVTECVKRGSSKKGIQTFMCKKYGNRFTAVPTPEEFKNEVDYDIDENGTPIKDVKITKTKKKTDVDAEKTDENSDVDAEETDENSDVDAEITTDEVKETKIYVNGTCIKSFGCTLSLDDSFQLVSSLFSDIVKNNAQVSVEKSIKIINFSIKGGEKG